MKIQIYRKPKKGALYNRKETPATYCITPEIPIVIPLYVCPPKKEHKETNTYNNLKLVGEECINCKC